MRRPLPRYGRPSHGLNDWRVHVARVSGLPDGYLSQSWRVTPRAVRYARTGRTWRHVATKPDTTPRARTGNWFGLTAEPR